jgi:hypothetical protein
MEEEKVAHIRYPELGKNELLRFHAKDFHAASHLYFHVMKNNGVIVDLKNFSELELELLRGCRTPSGEYLIQNDKAAREG